ncbi:XRE family transcriptional regulator [Geomonas silvestris]|uniref:XRE family transcriptional regulator n=1 Tax=Geomonas silvestris TaxID=2740184 RepID=A0A6V8MIH6_9BACT|nr:cupin domain-containing protein [Geomonas silvestris]GFO59768.1 XRE family transcriptional regulator [Geomonas silvestris]
MRKYVGERVKKLREAQGLALEQVCKLTGIPADQLRAIEEGDSVPAIGVVIKLSRVLGSRMEGLLHGGGVVSESLTICRSGESLVPEQGDTNQGYAYKSLTRPGTAGHLMEPFLLSFDPQSEPGVPISHDGQEFVFVLDGEIELFYDGQSYRLARGDSAYLDASRPHTFHGLGDRLAQMMAVVSSG